MIQNNLLGIAFLQRILNKSNMDKWQNVLFLQYQILRA